MAGVLAGCGTAHRSQTTYVRPDGSSAQLRADENLCRQQAVGQIEDKIATYGQTMNRQVYDDCMRARGYDVDAASAAVRW
jgi:hypothetical protein